VISSTPVLRAELHVSAIYLQSQKPVQKLWYRFPIRANPFSGVCLFCNFVRNKISVLNKTRFQVVFMARYLYFLGFRYETFIILFLKLQAREQISTTQQVDLNLHVWNHFVHKTLHFVVHKTLHFSPNLSTGRESGSFLLGSGSLFCGVGIMYIFS